jgi:fluoroquinolone transport system ATP-binding protein
MIRVEDLSFSYTKRPFITGMNFDVKNGEIFGFLGPSGAGKSTLQKILTGLLTTYAGSAVVNGVEVRRMTTPFTSISAWILNSPACTKS